MIININFTPYLSPANIFPTKLSSNVVYHLSINWSVQNVHCHYLALAFVKLFHSLYTPFLFIIIASMRNEVCILLMFIVFACSQALTASTTPWQLCLTSFRPLLNVQGFLKMMLMETPSSVTTCQSWGLTTHHKLSKHQHFPSTSCLKRWWGHRNTLVHTLGWLMTLSSSLETWSWCCSAHFNPNLLGCVLIWRSCNLGRSDRFLVSSY